MDRFVHVYVLRDPRDGAVRYVGRSVSPRVRLSMHHNWRAPRAVNAWVSELRDLGLKPALAVVHANVPREHGPAQEAHFMALYARFGKLLNRAKAAPVGRCRHCGSKDHQGGWGAACKRARARKAA